MTRRLSLAALAASVVSWLFLLAAAFYSVFFLVVAWGVTGGVWWLAEEAESRLKKRALRGNVAMLTAKVLASLVAIASVYIMFLLVRRWSTCAPDASGLTPGYCKGGGLIG